MANSDEMNNIFSLRAIYSKEIKSYSEYVYFKEKELNFTTDIRVVMDEL